MSDTQNEASTPPSVPADSPAPSGQQPAEVETALTDSVADPTAPEGGPGDIIADGADSEGAEGATGSDDGDDSDDDDSADDSPLETEAEIAADYLEELLDIADLDGDIDTYIESNRAHVSIVSDSQTLVGSGGQVLDALQELARLAVMTETGERSRLMLDIAGYRDRRRRELLQLASDAIAEVRSTRESIALSPMNPFERKIVHDAVAAAGLTSASEGEEPKRRVVVQPLA